MARFCSSACFWLTDVLVRMGVAHDFDSAHAIYKESLRNSSSRGHVDDAIRYISRIRILCFFQRFKIVFVGS